jgi:hypothetical protein
MKNTDSIIRDPNSYIESIGRADKDGLLKAIKEKGRGTAIRVCLWRNN